MELVQKLGYTYVCITPYILINNFVIKIRSQHLILSKKWSVPSFDQSYIQLSTRSMIRYSVEEFC